MISPCISFGPSLLYGPTIINMRSLSSFGPRSTRNSGLSVEGGLSRMLLGTRRYQVGSDGGRSIVDASRNPTLPGWQPWKNINRGCPRNAETFNWHAWMLLLFDRQTQSAETKPGRQKGPLRNNSCLPLCLL